MFRAFFVSNKFILINIDRKKRLTHARNTWRLKYWTLHVDKILVLKMLRLENSLVLINNVLFFLFFIDHFVN